MDHHWIIIIIIASTISIKWCYLFIFLITEISTEPALFHVGCRPSLHVGLIQCLYLTLSQNGPPSTYIWPWEEHIQHHVRKAQHSHPIMGGTYPRTILVSLSTHIWSWEEHIQEPYRKGSTLTSDHGRNTSKNHIRKAQHLYLTMIGNFIHTSW